MLLSQLQSQGSKPPLLYQICRLQLVEAEIASAYHTGNTHNRDPIMCKIHTALDDNKDMNPDDSIVVKMKLNIASPEEYSGSSNLEVYETFVTGILHWLKMNCLLGTKHATFPSRILGNVGDSLYILIGSAGTELKAKNIYKKAHKSLKTQFLTCIY